MHERKNSPRTVRPNFRVELQRVIENRMQRAREKTSLVLTNHTFILRPNTYLEPLYENKILTYSLSQNSS